MATAALAAVAMSAPTTIADAGPRGDLCGKRLARLTAIAREQGRPVIP